MSTIKSINKYVLGITKKITGLFLKLRDKYEPKSLSRMF